MAALSINAFNAALTLRVAFDAAEIVVLLATAVTALMLFALAIHGQARGATVSGSLRTFVLGQLNARLPLRYAVITAALTVITLAAAVQLGSAREELSLAVVEGLRTGALVLVGLKAWRLAPGGRLLTVATWIAADIWVHSAVVVPGIGSGWVTFTSGVAAGWALLRTQHWAERKFLDGRLP